MENTKIMKTNSASEVILQFNLSRAPCAEWVRNFIVLWQQAHFMAPQGSLDNHCRLALRCVEHQRTVQALESQGWNSADSAGKEVHGRLKNSAAELGLHTSAISALILCLLAPSVLCVFGSHDNLDIALRRS